ncbi:hypothetical protein BSY15_558 [Acidovorax sp. RAC01]|nr:hypothetical protein BSY15_558 [Acidovorax sp. RAC01]
MRPNPLLKLSRYGKRCKPELHYARYPYILGLRHLPPRAG